jgi:hypothetical protein
MVEPGAETIEIRDIFLVTTFANSRNERRFGGARVALGLAVSHSNANSEVELS